VVLSTVLLLVRQVAVAGTFTTATATSVQATNIKANDGTAAMTIADSTGAVATLGALTVGGNLTVNGTTTSIDSVTLTIEDPLITLAKNNSGGDANVLDQGLLINRGSLDNVSMIWDESEDEFAMAVTAAEAGATAGNITIDSYAALHAGVTTVTDLQTGTISAADGATAATVADSTGVITLSGDLSVGDNNITNVGDDCSGLDQCRWHRHQIAVSDNSATALTVKEGANVYLTFDSRNTAEVSHLLRILLLQQLKHLPQTQQTLTVVLLTLLSLVLTQRRQVHLQLQLLPAFKQPTSKPTMEQRQLQSLTQQVQLRSQLLSKLTVQLLSLTRVQQMLTLDLKVTAMPTCYLVMQAMTELVLKLPLQLTHWT
jgi:hypothetical protein